MAEKTDKVLLEREYIIPLRREWLKAAEYKRVPKAVKAIRKFIARHMKVAERDASKVKINKWLNQELWFRGIRKPPARIKVKARKYEDHVDVELIEIPERVKWQIAREGKRFMPAPKREEKKEEKEALEQKVEEKKEEVKTVEKKEETPEEKKEKIEAVKEAGLQHALEERHQHKHETAHKKEKTTPRRMALQK